jgi:hypothetical protein
MKKKKRDNRIHRLLGYFLDENEKKPLDGHLDYKPMIPYIKPRYKRLLYFLRILNIRDNDLYEVRLLCYKLFGDEIITIQPDEFGVDIDGSTDLASIRDAYFANEYRERNAGIIAIYVSTILNALAATALTVLTYLSDRSGEIQRDQVKEIQQLHKEVEKNETQSKVLRDSVNLLKPHPPDTATQIPD